MNFELSALDDITVSFGKAQRTGPGEFDYSHFNIKEKGASFEEALRKGDEMLFLALSGHKNVWWRSAPRIEEDRAFDTMQITYYFFARGCSW